MDKLIIFSFYLLIGLTFALPNPRQLKQDTTKNPLTFDDVIPSKFSLQGFNGTWISGSEFYYRNSEGDINIYNVADGTHRLFLARDVLSNWTSPSITVSPDTSQILIRYAVRSIFRHSIVAKYAVYDISSQTSFNISDSDELNICVWSPANGDLVYVKNNDVYFRKSNGGVVQLTNDGIVGVVYNGIADWVYEEEVLSSSNALWFSPDGTKLAIASFNDTDVEEFTYYMYGEPGIIDNQYPEEIHLRYPKAGTTNPTVALKVRDLTNDAAEWKDLKAPLDLVSADHILGSVAWSGNDSLMVQWLNRRQNYTSYQTCDFASGTCTNRLEFSEPDGWIDVNTPKCLLDGWYCFFIASFAGSFHAMSNNKGSDFAIPETYGDISVSTIYGFDQNGNYLYYLANTFDKPQERQVYRNNICLTCPDQGPDQVNCSYASASFSKDFSYYAFTCSGPSPSYTKLMKTSDNTEVFAWQENLITRENLTNFSLPNIVHLRVPVTTEFNAAVKLRLPPGLNFYGDETGKYPMIVYVYGGPNSVRAVDSFGIGFADYMASNRNVIEAIIDGRGSGNKGTKMLFALNNKLGTVEIEDQIAVTKYLQQTYKFIDAERTGIWGWSYGGFSTAMALAKDTERVFQCGISVAPVTSFIYYDSIYTERFMGLPTPEDNEIGYNDTDVSRILDEFKNHDFMLIHGNADDNVHYQQSMSLSRALQKANIMFEQMSYPDEAHSLTGVSKHLYHTMDQFWVDCLNLGADD